MEKQNILMSELQRSTGWLQTFRTNVNVAGCGPNLGLLQKEGNLWPPAIRGSSFHYETQNQSFFKRLAYIYIYTPFGVHSRHNQDTSSPLTSREPVGDTCAKHQATNVVTARQSTSKQAGTDLHRFPGAPEEPCSLFGWIGTDQNVIPIELLLEYHAFVVDYSRRHK